MLLGGLFIFATSIYLGIKSPADISANVSRALSTQRPLIVSKTINGSQPSQLSVANTVQTKTPTYGLVGKWQDPKTRQTMEFMNNGDLIIDTGNMVFTGTYEKIGTEYLKINLSGMAGAWAAMEGADSWRYSISGNKLTITDGGNTTTLTRLP